jgi:hypothetical protein
MIWIEPVELPVDCWRIVNGESALPKVQAGLPLQVRQIAQE